MYLVRVGSVFTAPGRPVFIIVGLLCLKVNKVCARICFSPILLIHCRSEQDIYMGDRLMNRSIIGLVVLISVFFDTGPAIGEVTFDWVTVGNPGNAGDTEVMGTDGTTGYGSVPYTYPTLELPCVGFLVASIPEPASFILLVFMGVAVE